MGKKLYIFFNEMNVETILMVKLLWKKLVFEYHIQIKIKTFIMFAQPFENFV